MHKIFLKTAYYRFYIDKHESLTLKFEEDKLNERL